ncbi:MAG: tryptophan--tRNA ligase [Bacilli bacterium]
MKRIVTGLKPSGDLTLGNYVGVIKSLVEMQDEYEILIFIADLHAITTRQDRLELRKRIKEFSAIYIACGLDPNKIKIFIQSEIQAHAQLGWILLCNTYIGELNRMTQYKDKVNKEGTAKLTGGFYTYPSLMAADILLYDADVVFVGNDQLQHLEITRDIATRFNNEYGETFKVPEPMSNKTLSRVMDLQDPLKKMSKSESNKGCIILREDISAIKKKIRSAVTDSDTKIYYDKDNKPGIANLLELYALFSKISLEKAEDYFKNRSYKELKDELAELIGAEIEKIQQRYNELVQTGEIDNILNDGYEYCNKLALRKIAKIEHKVGLNRKK